MIKHIKKKATTEHPRNSAITITRFKNIKLFSKEKGKIIKRRKQQVSIRNDKKDLKNNQMDLPKIKNTTVGTLMNGLNRLDRAENKINKLEDITEIT